MSRTTIICLWPGKRQQEHIEYPNSWGSAPVVWEAMAQRYLGILKSYSYPDQGWMQRLDEVWALWQRQDISQAHRAVLMLTFDRAYVTRANYSRMAEDIERFLADFPVSDERANHWPLIASWFYASVVMKDMAVPATGLWCTSVSNNPFWGEWDEEKECYKEFDWSTALDIYEDLDALNGEQPASPEPSPAMPDRVFCEPFCGHAVHRIVEERRKGERRIEQLQRSLHPLNKRVVDRRKPKVETASPNS